VGSKLSGYTKEYLERLCVLHKVNFLLWNNDQHVIELESLLKETQTILLSYEGLDFVDKAGLSVPPAEPFNLERIKEVSAQDEQARPLAASIPHFVESGRLPSRELNAGMFSFTGRAVVSDSRHPNDTEDKETHIPISVLHEGAAEQPAVLSRASTPVILEKKSEVPPAALQHMPLHMTVVQHHETPVMSQNTVKKVSLPVTRESSIPPPVLPVHDDWEEHLFGGSLTPAIATPPPAPEALLPATPPVALPYHPIHTSVDASPHHEDLPLFPKLIDKSLLPALLPAAKEEEKIPVRTAPSSVAPSENIISAKDPSPVWQPPRSSLPVMRVMSQALMSEQKNLPQRAPEHHLAVLEPHPLMKSVGFNMSFALLFLIPSFIVWSGMLTRDAGVSSVKEMNLAAVGVLDETQAEPKESAPVFPAQEEQREFSDEVVVAAGETPHSVLVQPIFKEGAGMVHEYFNALGTVTK
jgi:hypothetical protein